MNKILTSVINGYRSQKLASLRKRPTAYSNGRPIVVGFLSSPSGLGEGARLIYRALELEGHNPSSFDLTPTIQPNLEVIENGFNEDDDGVGPIILHVNPPEILKAFSLLTKQRLDNRKVIGVWAWEQEILPAFWVKSQAWIDEIWASSQFMENIFRKSLSCPVIYTGYPSSLLGSGLKSRERQANKPFVFFTTFDPRSGIKRKNPNATVEAFLEAFPSDNNVRLIIKITDRSFRDNIPLEWESDCRIMIEDNLLNANEMADLLFQCDCAVSLHRAEGYGFLAAKALANGIPIISTDYSAVSEFMSLPIAFPVSYKKVPADDQTRGYGARYGSWAEPDHESAVNQMRMVRNIPSDQLLTLSGRSAAQFRSENDPNIFVSRIAASLGGAVN